MFGPTPSLDSLASVITTWDSEMGMPDHMRTCFNANLKPPGLITSMYEHQYRSMTFPRMDHGKHFSSHSMIPHMQGQHLSDSL